MKELLEAVNTVRDIRDALDTLHNDADNLRHVTAATPQDMPSRRHFVRAFMALVEAATYMGKQMLVIALAFDSESKDFSPPQMACINETEWTLKDDGTVELKRAKIGFKPNFRFLARLFDEHLGVEQPAWATDVGWSHLTATIKVRDRLMHPKRNSDLLVHDNELKAAQDAFLWVGEFLDRRFGALADYAESNLEKKQKGIDTA